MVNISDTSVRVPGYFMGGGRSDYEIASAVRFKNWLSEHPAAIVVDVGCSVSTYGVIALCASSQTRVVAIDPDFASLVWTQFLCSKARPPGRLRLVHGFVVSNPEPAQDVEVASANTGKILNRSRNAFAAKTKYQDSSDPTNIKVPRHSLDALFGQMAIPDGLLIKIDVEGHELDVLKGATRILSQARPTLLLSVHPQFGLDVSQMREFLEKSGYSADHFATDHEEHWWCAPIAS